MIFKIPDVPDASNLEEGFVITSIFQSDLLGILCRAFAPSSIPKSEDGLPLIKNFTLVFPLIETVPSVSTDTEGTLVSTSCNVPPLLIRSVDGS